MLLQFGLKRHALSVTDMKPDPQGTLMDTCVEVDLDFSAEYKKLQKNSFKTHQDNFYSKMDSARKRLGRKLEDTIIDHYNNNNNNYNNNNNSNNYANYDHNNNDDDDNNKDAVLDIPLEPDESEVIVVKIKLKLPNNRLGSRRFWLSQPIKHLFLYESSVANIDFNKIQLKAHHPTRVINSTTADLEKNITEHGLNEGQEVIHVIKLSDLNTKQMNK